MNEVLEITNRKLKSKYQSEDLRLYEQRFYDMEVTTLEQLKYISPRAWKNLEMPLDLTNNMRKILNWHSVLASRAQQQTVIPCFFFSFLYLKLLT